MPRKILVVDDEPMIRQLVKFMLRGHYEVDAANSGEEGLEAICSRGPYAAIVSDLCLQGMHGASFLKKASELAPDIPRLAVTGGLPPGDEASDGIFRCFAKPYDAESLRAALDEAIAETERAQSAKARMEQMAE